MAHYYLHWTDHEAYDTSLWYFKVKHTVWLNNILPNYCSGITPLEFLTRNNTDHWYLSMSHVWGCPIFVLDPKIKNDQKIPKWNRRSCLGHFLGFLEHHSSLTANSHHIKIGHISPQYQVVFDDLFETMYSTGENDPIVDAIWKNLFDHKHDWYVLEEYDKERELLYKPPPLHEVWITDHGWRQHK